MTTEAPVRSVGVGEAEGTAYREDTQPVLYRFKMNPNLRRNFALFPVLDWISRGPV